MHAHWALFSSDCVMSFQMLLPDVFHELIFLYAFSFSPKYICFPKISRWKFIYAGLRYKTLAKSCYSQRRGPCLHMISKHSRMFSLGCTNLIISVDHKPLLGVFNNQDLCSIQNPPLQSMKENTFGLSFQIVYNPGKSHRGSDILFSHPGSDLVGSIKTNTEYLYT